LEALQFRTDGTFKIVQFTDLHWTNGGEKDLQTQRLMRKVLEEERPDFVVVTGDLLSGGGCEDPRWSWRQAVLPIEEAGIPWAFVFGNHDDEGPCDRASLMALTSEMKHCLTESGPEDLPGVGNYRLVVRRSEAGIDEREGGEPGAIFYFIDSQSYAPEEIGGWGWITHEQVAWYRETAKAHRGEAGPNVPALCFLHIPVPEYEDAWQAGACVGMKGENVCAPKVNTGFFASLLEMGEVIGVFAGHDHVNDYIGRRFGIYLAYGKVTGYSTYPRDGQPRGARVILLREGERNFETWIRLDDGRVLYNVTTSL